MLIAMKDHLWMIDILKLLQTYLLVENFKKYSHLNIIIKHHDNNLGDKLEKKLLKIQM